MLTLSFKSARLELLEVKDKHDLLLGVVATVTLSVDARVIYTEVMFPIVELRVALERWLRTRDDLRENFEFESMESDEVGLIWFRRQSSGRWRAGSVHQDELALRELNSDEVGQGCTDYISAVDDWVRAQLSIEVWNVVEI